MATGGKAYLPQYREFRQRYSPQTAIWSLLALRAEQGRLFPPRVRVQGKSSSGADS